MKDGSPKAAVFVAIVFVLFGAYASYAAFLTGLPDRLPLVSGIAAKDGEDSEDSGDDDSQSEDEEEDDSQSEEDDNSEEESKSEDEAAKKAEEQAKERAKKAAEAAKRAERTSSGSSGQGGASASVADDSDELSESSESTEDGMTEDSEDSSGEKPAEIMKHLNEKLAEADKEIREKQAEGVDVTAALAVLALAREKAQAVESALATADIDTLKAMAKEAERLAKSARGKVLHLAKKAYEDVAKVDKRISQTKEKLAALEVAGGDAAPYRDRLAAVETEWAGVKSVIKTGGEGVATALAQIEPIERRVKAIKSAVESALLALGASDDDFEMSEYEDELSEASSDLADLAEIAGDEEGDHAGLKRLASAHRADADEAAELVKRYESRSVGMRQLFGDDKQSLEGLRGLITANEARIEAMESVIALVDDQEVAALMQEKLSDLKAQNATLQSYVDAHPAENGLLGWLFNWF